MGGCERADWPGHPRCTNWQPSQDVKASSGVQGLFRSYPWASKSDEPVNNATEAQADGRNGNIDNGEQKVYLAPVSPWCKSLNRSLIGATAPTSGRTSPGRKTWSFREKPCGMTVGSRSCDIRQICSTARSSRGTSKSSRKRYWHHTDSLHAPLSYGESHHGKYYANPPFNLSDLFGSRSV